METGFLAAATGFYLIGFATTLFALGGGKFQPGRFNVLTMALGFACQTGFLWIRGQQNHSCPINSLFEVLIFLTWSMVGLYLVFGPAFRLSLLGAFTAIFVFVLQVVAIVAPLQRGPHPRSVLNPWLELHAALSIVAYGAFGMAAVAGVMYLVQEFQLKSRHPAAIFYHLPPISTLHHANERLVGLGVVVLTIGLLAGLMVGSPTNFWKWAVSLVVLVLYGGILTLQAIRRITPKRVAAASVGVFSFALITLPAIQWLSVQHGSTR